VLKATSQTDSSKSGTANVIIVSGGFEPEPGTQYTVTLNRQDGSGETESVTAFYGSPLPPVTVPALVGSTFAGYWTEPGGYGTQYYTATGMGARNGDIAADTTLYTRWVPAGSEVMPVNYIVSFDTGGGSAVEAQTVAQGGKVTQPANPVREGYAFAGWYKEAEGGTEVTDETLVTTTENHTLYVHWIGNPYRMTFDRQGGSEAYTNGQTVVNLAATQDATVNLYAVWTPITTP